MALSGIVVVDKPPEWTSQDVVAKLRGVFHVKRVGHGGTLDPMATGVLPVFVGRATRAADFVAGGEKEYVADLLLGVETDTQDVTGRVLRRQDGVRIAPEAMEEALKGFRGEILQTPPMYSAIKVGGRKLYELARQGVEVERTPRRVTISTLEILSREEPDRFTLRVVCSKGTYIRALCHDIGQTLGCGGCMSALRRTRVGRFTLDQAVTMETLTALERPEEALVGVDRCFDAPQAVISGTALRRARCGNPFPLAGEPGEVRVYDPEGNFLLLGRRDGRECRIVKSFYEVD